MLLYTPLPHELVLEGLNPVPRYRETIIGGVSVLVEETSAGMGRVVRILSTNPFDYLNPALSPGNEVLIRNRSVVE